MGHSSTETPTDTVKETPKEGVESTHSQTYGEIINDGTNGEQIEVSNPVQPKRAVSVGEKTRRALALKLAGASYASIADSLGYSDASGARKAVMRGLESGMQENANELRQIHYGRLEHLLMLLWSDVNQKDLASMNTALSVMDRMTKLYGLDAPAELNINAGKETVIVADGGKDEYLKALKEAGQIIEAELISEE
jgi:hypothetical protein